MIDTTPAVWLIGATLALTLAFAAPARADDPATADDGPDPAAYRQQMMGNPNLQRLDGEAFTWHARSGVGRFFNAYEAFGDERWLEEASVYFDWLIEQMETEPDGYRGWVGARIGTDGELQGPHVVGDANLIEPMLHFAEIVAADEALQEQFGDKADEYVDVALEVIEKWDARGSWEVDGDFAVYTQQDQWRRRDNPGEFVTIPELKRTENMNKSGKMGVAFLRLYRITGDEQWRDRAVRIFSQYKRIMRYFEDEDRYIFNFWEPFGPWDINEDNVPVGWINVHPNRAGYQGGELGMIVEAYHNGIVFTEEDMQRLIRTNHFMWNGDEANPDFVAADGRSDAGTLWDALADFDETIRELRLASAMRGGDSLNNRIDRAYAERVLAQQPISFERRHVTSDDQLIIPDINLYESRELNFAAAIPGHVTPGEAVVHLATQVRGQGTLRIDLFDDEGEHVATLDEREVDGTESFDGRAGFETLVWDGRVEGEPLPAGHYTVRWTLNDSRRERGLEIR
ncbi:MAG: hypothetical protein WD009_07760 [Phycisphaeraceae bacterium]